MPLKRCYKNGQQGWKWGNNGTCFTGPNARSRAIKQAIAIIASGYKEGSNKAAGGSRHGG